MDYTLKWLGPNLYLYSTEEKNMESFLCFGPSLRLCQKYGFAITVLLDCSLNFHLHCGNDVRELDVLELILKPGHY